MKPVVLIILLAMFLCAPDASPSPAADELDEFIKAAKSEYSAFRDEAMTEYEAYRDSAMAGLNAWILQKWEPRPIEEPVKPPHDDKPVPPVVLPPDVPSPLPEDDPVRDEPVVAPTPLDAPPAPTPVLPPAPPAPPAAHFVFRSYGTVYDVDANPAIRRCLPGTDMRDMEGDVSRALKNMDAEQLNRLHTSVSKAAAKHRLSDWAYLKLTEHFVESFLPDNINGRKLLQGLLLLAEGYDVRFAGCRDTGRIYLLVGCRELLFRQIYYDLGTGYYYPLENVPDRNVKIMPLQLDGTRPLSVQPSGKEIFDDKAAGARRVAVCMHTPHCYENKCSSPAATYEVKGNANRMAFLSECPKYMVPGRDYSVWNAYVQTRLSDEYEAQLYPSMRKALQNRNSLESVNFIMHFVEAFDYKLDSDMWGVEDRAFFPDETLYYPYRDCEDGAILFTRLVRDLLGLPAALVYYPGHLAAAVAFDMPVKGAYIMHNGRRYTICDPTYYYVDAGVQMPSDVVDASKAVLIPLN